MSTSRAWATASLGELVDASSGGTPKRSEPRYWDGDIPWVKIGDMLQGTITSTSESITSDGLNESSAKLFPAGTLLLSIFATIGRTAVLGIEASTNQAIAALTIKEPSRIHTDYLRLYLEQATPKLASQSRGVAQNNINLSILKSLAIPLPPLEEQKRIAGILDAADQLRTKHQQALEKIDTLSNALRQQAFSGDL